jgi:hypothetical protein
VAADLRAAAVRAGGAAHARGLSSPPRIDTGPNGPPGDRGERHVAMEILVHRTDLGSPDDGGKRKGGFQPREVFTDTRTRSAGERDEVPAVAVLGAFRTEPVGIEDERVVPHGRIPMQGIDPHRHETARLDSVAVDLDVAQRQPTDSRGGRAQPQRLVQHLNGVPEPRHILGCQPTVADRGGLGGDAALYVGMVPQRPQRVGERRCGRVVAGQDEDQQVVGDVVVGERLPGLGVGGRDQRVNERCITRWIGAARLQDVVGDLAHRRNCGAGAAARRSR